jgi:hypothetical protein
MHKILIQLEMPLSRELAMRIGIYTGTAVNKKIMSVSVEWNSFINLVVRLYHDKSIC